MENYKIEKLNNTDAVVISDEEIKINDSITDGYRVWYWRDNCSLLGRKKVIATISPFKIEGLPMLELGKSHRIEILLKPEHIELLNGGNIKITNNKVEYTLPQKFINENDKWFIELPNQEEDIEKLAMDELKDKWGHLYQFGYPKKPYPTNYEKDLNLIMVGYSKAAQKQYSEDDMKKAIEMAQKFNVDTQYDEYDVMHESFKHIYSEEQIIQSLSTQQFPTSVELTEEEYCLPMPNIHVKKYKLKVIKWYYE